MGNTGRLCCLLGKSGCGKDTLFKLLLSRNPWMHPVVTYTTRPRRGMETEGVEYHFVTPQAFRAFETAGRLIERRSYHTMQGIWHYGTVDDGSIDFNKGSFLLIATLEGLRGLRRRFGDSIVPVYLEVEDGERLQRLVSRERAQTHPDYCELCRRFLADEEDFSPSRLRQAGIGTVFHNDNLEHCAVQVEAYLAAWHGAEAQSD